MLPCHVADTRDIINNKEINVLIGDRYTCHKTTNVYEIRGVSFVQ